jgi:hypothetical protein
VDWFFGLKNKPMLPIEEFSWYRTSGAGVSADLSSSGSGKVLTFTPCPKGLVVNDYLYISQGTGTAEKALITATTCAVSSHANGTATITTSNAHSGAWRAGSASAGIQEAVRVALAAGGGIVTVPDGTHTLYATINMPTGGVKIRGGGKWTTFLNRTTDYGDTFVIGTAAVSAVTDVEISDMWIKHTINYNGTTIVNKPTSGAHIRIWGPYASHFKNLRLNDMPYNLVINGGAYSRFNNMDFQGLWDYSDSNLQVTTASVQLNRTTPQEHPVGHIFEDCNFFGYDSPSRTWTLNATNVTSTEFVGPKYMVQINSAESVHFKSGLAGGASDYNWYFYSHGTDPLLEVQITGMHLDGARLGDIGFDTDGGKVAMNIKINNNWFNGENRSINAIHIKDLGAGTAPVAGLNITNNQFMAYGGSALRILDGRGISIANNSIRYYNVHNAYATEEGASAIHIGNRADYVEAIGNQLGGGQLYEGYGSAANRCLFGITIEDWVTANVNTKLVGNYLAGAGVIGTADDLMHRNTLTKLKLTGIQSFADNAAALAGGLIAGDVYYTSTGVLMKVY